MPTLRTLREFDFALAATAAKRICTVVGAIVIGSWFAVERHPLELTAAVLFVALAWVMTFMAIRAWRVQFSTSTKSQRIGGRTARANGKPATNRPADRVGMNIPIASVNAKRFLYFDSESGDPVYKIETGVEA